ncbi:MAG: hypothetical protein ACXVCP_18860 [Bdellovibrio sp.]
MKFLISISTILIIFSDSRGYSTESKSPVTEEKLTQCYQQFPLLQQNIMLISDKDFADKSKSKLRISTIKRDFEKQPLELRKCVENVIQYAKDQKDPENLNFILLRTKEFRSVVYGNSGPKNKPKAKGLR